MEGDATGGAAALSPFPALQPGHPVIERLEVSDGLLGHMRAHHTHCTVPATLPTRISSHLPTSRARSATSFRKRAPSSRWVHVIPTSAKRGSLLPQRLHHNPQVFDLSAEQPLEYYAVFNQYQVGTTLPYPALPAPCT